MFGVFKKEAKRHLGECHRVEDRNKPFVIMSIDGGVIVKEYDYKCVDLRVLEYHAYSTFEDADKEAQALTRSGRRCRVVELVQRAVYDIQVQRKVDPAWRQS